MSYKIEEICEINCDSLSKKDSYSYINYLDTGNLTQGIVDEIKRLDVENDKIPSRAKRKVKKGDILISTVRPNQKHYGMVDGKIENLIVSTGFAVIRPGEKVDPSYLYKYLTLPEIEEYLQSIAETSVTAYPSITPSVIGNLEIELPPLEEQKAIANILSSLDEKIELNNQMNKTLEEMAQTLFKRWFVDFEFPNEEGEPYKSSGGEMVDSELGMIPKGWRVKKISEVIEVKDGTHASPKPVKEGYALVTSKCINGDSLSIEQANLISEADYIEVNKRSKVDTGDILISMIGTVGLIYFVQEKNINFAIKNIGLFKASQNEEISEYLYLYLKTPDLKNYIDARLAGTTQKYISLGELRNIPILIPESKLLAQFKDIAKIILDNKRNNIIESQNLKEMRDTLLPKLMSGEIRVKDLQI